MARIYYYQEKLSGNAFKNNIINSELFDYIFENTSYSNFEILPTSKKSFFRFLKSTKEIFKMIQISRDGIDYKANEGNFYLPKAIIFCDKNDYNFPSEFYFIAKIGDKIEIRKCKGGKEVKWFQIPDLHGEVTEKKIILKLENSLLELKKIIETTYNKQFNIDNKEKKEIVQRKIEEEQPLLDQNQKKAYKNLIELCAPLNPKKEQIILFIEQLKKYDQNKSYYATLNCLLNFLDQNQISFILRLDWKAAIEDLKWVLELSLKQNFNLVIELPDEKSYEENVSVSFHHVFQDFEKALIKKGLQIGFINTESDEYVFIIHKILDKKEIKKVINLMGYEYQESQE
ncbi:hypothetical protein V3Q90_13055 [Flavobacterium oreochromis]|uniref:DUF6630 family protein n=1 Tax=Flavobacterium oreochromis TaxID=2906078 RepID=UPI00385F0896